MFITRRRYEKDLNKARKHGYKKALKDNEVIHNMEYIERNMYASMDRVHERLEVLENKIKICEKKEK